MKLEITLSELHQCFIGFFEIILKLGVFVVFVNLSFNNISVRKFKDLLFMTVLTSPSQWHIQGGFRCWYAGLGTQTICPN